MSTLEITPEFEPFELIEVPNLARWQEGVRPRRVTQTDYPLALVYIGYTSCPTICGAALTELTAGLAALGEDADRLAVLYMTIDPERDTVEVMREFLHKSYPRINGLTGSAKEIEHAQATFDLLHVTPRPDGTLAHSAIYYVLADGVLVDHITAGAFTDAAGQLDTKAFAARLRRNLTSTAA